jgi:transcriptional regulator with XRE-family HTH domain
MPRQDDSAREPYKPKQDMALGRIEDRRRKLGVTVHALAERAGMSPRQLARIRRDGRAWLREIRAMTMALRSIEKEKLAEGAMFTD